MDQATHLRKMVKLESESRHRLKRFATGKPALGGNTPRVIAITSGKGGVGKTNVVGNLAIAFQQLGQKVLIFDADLGLANIDIIYGLQPRHNIEDIISGTKELSEVIVRGPEGVAVIPASSGVQDLVHLTEGQKINLLNEFDTLNDAFDILLIDTAAGISSNVLYFNLAAAERIVVVTPEPTSITDAYALMKVMHHQHGTKNFLLLPNMVASAQEAKSVYENLSTVMARFMGGIAVGYAGYIPYDRNLPRSVTRRTPVICSHPEGPAGRGFKTLAHGLLTQTDVKPMDGSIKFFWKRLMDVSNG